MKNGPRILRKGKGWKTCQRFKSTGSSKFPRELCNLVGQINTKIKEIPERDHKK